MSAELQFQRSVDLLRSWGITVREQPGCWGRSNGIGWDREVPVAPLVHHFVCPLDPDQDRIDGFVSMLVNGYDTTPGPVVNWFVDMHGVAYFICSGPANHSGRGDTAVLARVGADQSPLGPAAQFGGANDFNGNAFYTGKETQHPGDASDYPKPLIDTLVAVCAAESIAFGWTANRTMHHYEHTNRKDDMSWRGGINGDGGPELRRRIAALIIEKTTTNEGDWFDMATQQDLVNAVGQWFTTARTLDNGREISPLNQILEQETQTHEAFNNLFNALRAKQVI